MSDPLQITFEVACTVDHAFVTWTERIGTWWPTDHTVSGAPRDVVVEGWVGGRIYECTVQGHEHRWGAITSWRPPEQLAFQWHLGVGPGSATEVEVTFSSIAGEKTRVEITQSGWERLGLAGPELRSRNRVGWEALIPRLRSAAEKGE